MSLIKWDVNGLTVGGSSLGGGSVSDPPVDNCSVMYGGHQARGTTSADGCSFSSEDLSFLLAKQNIPIGTGGPYPAVPQQWAGGEIVFQVFAGTIPILLWGDVDLHSTWKLIDLIKVKVPSGYDATDVQPIGTVIPLDNTHYNVLALWYENIPKPQSAPPAMTLTGTTNFDSWGTRTVTFINTTLNDDNSDGVEAVTQISVLDHTSGISDAPDTVTVAGHFTV